MSWNIKQHFSIKRTDGNVYLNRKWHVAHSPPAGDENVNMQCLNTEVEGMILLKFYFAK